MAATATSSQKAKDKPRDAGGKFVSKNTKPEDTATRTTTVTGPIAVINEALDDPSIDKPLFSLTINNPIRKLLGWIKEIKKKQTTTFEFKIKVPLIALPVFMVVLGSAFTFFFNLGKKSEQASTVVVSPTPVATVSPILTPAPVYLSKVGVVKGTYQVLSLIAQADATATPIPPTSTPEPTHSPTATPTLIPTPTPPLSRFVLLDKDERITFLLAPATVKLESYLNKRVLVYGLYDQKKETLEIKKASDIEILPY